MNTIIQYILFFLSVGLAVFYFLKPFLKVPSKNNSKKGCSNSNCGC